MAARGRRILPSTAVLASGLLLLGCSSSAEGPEATSRETSLVQETSEVLFTYIIQRPGEAPVGCPITSIEGCPPVCGPPQGREASLEDLSLPDDVLTQCENDLPYPVFDSVRLSGTWTEDGSFAVESVVDYMTGFGPDGAVWKSDGS